MKIIKVSIIIPVYNVEKYLKKCLDSCINQTLEEIEIICINDASEDESLKILNEYAITSKKIVVINCKINRGLGAVRNMAILVAKGEYILFVDSDDWLDIYAAEKLWKIAAAENLDILEGKAIVYEENSEKKRMKEIPLFKKFPAKPLSGRDYFVLQGDYFGVIWNKIWKKSFIIENNLRCFEGSFFEDLPFTLIGILKAARIKNINYPFYYYRIRNNSITNSKTTLKHLHDYHLNILKFLDLQIRNTKEKKILQLLKKLLSRNIVLAFYKRLGQYKQFDMGKLKYFFIYFSYLLKYPLGVSKELWILAKRKNTSNEVSD